MSEHYLAERGIAYRKNEFIEGRETLVWIHGLSGSLSAWFAYEKLFADYNLLTIDLRGHGRSERPKRYRDYELKLFAEDVHELLNYLHVDKCIFISHSFGTLVALEYISAHPARISAVIFLSPTAYLRSTFSSYLVNTLGRAVIAICRLLPFSGKRRGRVDYTMFTYTGDWDLRRIVRDVFNTTIHSYMYCLGHAYSKGYDDLWKNIAVPTLIIHGTKDSYVSADNSIRLSKEISGSKLVLLENANHIIVLNNTNDVSEHIRIFLTSQ